MATSLLNDKSIQKKWRVLTRISYALSLSVILDGNGWIWKNDYVAYTVYSLQCIGIIFLGIITWIYYKNRKVITVKIA